MVAFWFLEFCWEEVDLKISSEELYEQKLIASHLKNYAKHLARANGFFVAQLGITVT